MEIRRGDVVWVWLSGAIGAEKRGDRPALVVQNNRGNVGSPLTIVVPLTGAEHGGRVYRQQVFVPASDLWDGAKDSIVECGHIRTIDRAAQIDEARGVLARLSDGTMDQVDAALRASLSLA